MLEAFGLYVLYDLIIDSHAIHMLGMPVEGSEAGSFGTMSHYASMTLSVPGIGQRRKEEELCQYMTLTIPLTR